MNAIRKLSLLGTVAALGVSVSGCLVGTEQDEPVLPATGTLTIDYTIENAIDPTLCLSYGVTDAELVIYTPAGDYVKERYGRCVDFLVSATLFPGTYSADVTLIDDSDRARSITKTLYDLEVVGDEELVVDVEFPPGSML